MRKLLASLQKEWLLLWRDKVGLVILFLLPMCLVLFISITQPDDSKMSVMPILVVNQDGGPIAEATLKGLNKIDFFKVTQLKDTSKHALVKAEDAVAKGTYKAAIIIPAQLSQQVNRYAGQIAKRHTQANITPRTLMIYTDPALPISVRMNMVAAVTQLMQQIEVSSEAKVVSQVLRLPIKVIDQSLVKVDYQTVQLPNAVKQPNAVQQNVPAWSLFGMFFIVIPLAGAMVKEREEGVVQRLKLAPVADLSLLVGKIIAFVFINQIQLWLMLSVGVWILPLFGLPQLDLFNHVSLVFLTGICASLAATGFGVLIGTWARTYEQATVMGPFVIVIGAAIGGVLVPIDMMPTALQNISVISPLNWAQSAFIDIFVRGGDIQHILADLIKLLIFFCVTLFFSLLAPHAHFSIKPAHKRAQ